MDGALALWGGVGLPDVALEKIVLTIAVLAAIWGGRMVILRYITRRREDPGELYQWRKTSSYVAAVFTAALVVPIWVTGVQNTATYFGLLSAGLAIALQSLIVNLAGWAFILWRKPFKVGDRVQIGDVAGDVIDVRLFQFTLLEIGNWVHADQSTGRMIHVPNGAVFREVQANYTLGFEYIWNELPILVTFESEWRRAKTLLQEIAERRGLHLNEKVRSRVKEAARQYYIRYSTLSPTVYTSVEDSGVLLTIRYLCEARNRRGSAEAIWEDVLDAFAQETGIDFAYPTQRFYDNVREGKPGARASISAAEDGVSRPAA